MADTKEGLAARLARGDASALMEFYEAEVDAVYGFVLSRVGKDGALAEDIVQETFLEGLRQITSWDASRASLRTWLCLLSRNITRRELRVRQKESGHGRFEETGRKLHEAATQLAASPIASELIELGETRSSVAVVLSSMTESHQRALRRKYSDGASIEELAAEMAVSVEAAKSLLARARASFRELFLVLNTAERTP